TAMDLPGEQDRVHGHTEIVHDRVADDLGRPGLRIDLYLRDMRAVRIGALVLLELAETLEIGRPLGRLGDVSEGHGSVGADNACRAVGELDVGGRGFELVGGDPLDLLGEVLARAGCRDTAKRYRARAARAAAFLQPVGVALMDGDLRDVDV